MILFYVFKFILDMFYKKDENIQNKGNVNKNQQDTLQFECVVCQNSFFINKKDFFDPFYCPICKTIYLGEFKNNEYIANVKNIEENYDNETKEDEPSSKNNDEQNELLKHYRDLLKLKLNFNNEDLKIAYRKAVEKYHPDKYNNESSRNYENAEVLMKQINKAYEELKKYAK